MVGLKVRVVVEYGRNGCSRSLGCIKGWSLIM